MTMCQSSTWSTHSNDTVSVLSETLKLDSTTVSLFVRLLRNLKTKYAIKFLSLLRLLKIVADSLGKTNKTKKTQLAY